VPETLASKIISTAECCKESANSFPCPQEAP
jgi:hypothetical protein